MNIAVVGTGYVGLVTGACLAGSGNNVICVDIDEEKVNKLKKGKVYFFEPGLDEIVHTNIKEKRLVFTTDIASAINSSEIIFIAVGTPQSDNGAADISAVLEVAKSIGENLNDYKIVVTKSTVPVGTTEKVRNEIKLVSDVEFDVASNPEFLKEGAAVEDFLKPDRVVIGVDKESVGNTLKDLYSPFMRSGDRSIVVSIRSSEMAKYASNAMLATRISFMNDIANLCELVGANVSEIRRVMGADTRIGKQFLYPGLGYGGSCFPKDVRALIKTASEAGYDLEVSNAVDSINKKQRERFYNKIKNHFDGQLSGKKFAVWGLSFKPNTDDIREAPSLYIIEKILQDGGEITAHDPVSISNVKVLFGNKIKYSESYYDTCLNADALIINTEWNEYRQPNFDRIKKLMLSPTIFDGRNLYNSEKMKNLGIDYFGIGI
ncbi:MAG: UDP-glucose dehydrogenase family protein [Thermodesulfobacteriota bacterium]